MALKMARNTTHFPHFEMVALRWCCEVGGTAVHQDILRLEGWSPNLSTRQAFQLQQIFLKKSWFMFFPRSPPKKKAPCFTPWDQLIPPSPKTRATYPADPSCLTLGRHMRLQAQHESSNHVWSFDSETFLAVWPSMICHWCGSPLAPATSWTGIGVAESQLRDGGWSILNDTSTTRNSRFLGFPGPVMRLHYWKHDLNDVGSASPLEWYTINHQPWTIYHHHHTILKRSRKKCFMGLGG